MRKFLEKILYLLLIVCGVSAGLFQIIQIVGNDLGLFEGMKVTLIVHVILIPTVLILALITSAVTKYKYDTLKEIEWFAYIPYILTVFIYSFIKMQEVGKSIFSNIIMSVILTALYTFVPLMICTAVPMSQEERRNYKMKLEKEEKKNKWDSGISHTYFTDQFGNTVGKATTYQNSISGVSTTYYEDELGRTTGEATNYGKDTVYKSYK